jgi:hypothetical protein
VAGDGCIDYIKAIGFSLRPSAISIGPRNPRVQKSALGEERARQSAFYAQGPLVGNQCDGLNPDQKRVWAILLVSRSVIALASEITH